MKYLLGLIFLSLAACAPQHGGFDSNSPVAEDPITKPEEVDFAVIKKQLIEPYCIRCHQLDENGAPPKNGVVLETYDNLIEQKLIVAGDPEKSELYEIIESGEMPKRGPKVPAETLQLLEDWIAKGAPAISSLDSVLQ